jgi:hypothetical protein
MLQVELIISLEESVAYYKREKECGDPQQKKQVLS